MNEAQKARLRELEKGWHDAVSSEEEALVGLGALQLLRALAQGLPGVAG